MRHYYTEAPNCHFATNTNGYGVVLVQLGDERGEQVRICLTPEEARGFARLLAEKADKAESEFSLQDLLARVKAEQSVSEPPRS